MANLASDSNVEVNELLYEGISRDFFWLMHSLLPTNDKVKGCELIFPDTAFFKKGKPAIVIKSDTRDFCLVGVRQPKKLSLQSIYKDFQNIVRRRKKDFQGPFNKLYFQNQMRARVIQSPSEAGYGSLNGTREASRDGGLKRNESLVRRTTADLSASGMGMTFNNE